jgi:hypothetical protein
VAEPYPFPSKLAELDRRVEQLETGGGGGDPPHNDLMEARIKALEDFAGQAKERLARIEATMATKEDVTNLRAEMHKALNEQTWKIIGAFALLASVVFWIAKNVQ